MLGVDPQGLQQFVGDRRILQVAFLVLENYDERSAAFVHGLVLCDGRFILRGCESAGRCGRVLPHIWVSRLPAFGC